jgi:beta-lactamase class A
MSKHDPVRRLFSAAVLGSLFASPLNAARPGSSKRSRVTGGRADGSHIDELLVLERRTGARIGLKAVNTGTGWTMEHRADERFAMCSTHKVLVAAAILSLVERGTLTLDRRVAYSASDLLDYAPAAKANLARGFMTVEELCAAAVRLSDNTADNLLLRLIGGPAGWTRHARTIGDRVSRLDRFEPDLNTAIPDDPRDTTTPAAMTAALATMLLSKVLAPASVQRLRTWMLNAELTAPLFRAAIPGDWDVADKSGSGSNGTRNDVGILYPPSAPPLILSVFTAGFDATIEARNDLVRDCAAIVLKQAARDQAGANLAR